MNKLQIAQTILWLLSDAHEHKMRADYWKNAAEIQFKAGHGFNSYMQTSNDCEKLSQGSIDRANLFTLLLSLPELITYNAYFYRLMADEILIIEAIAPDDYLAVKWAMDNRPLRPFHCRAVNEPIPPRMALVVVS